MAYLQFLNIGVGGDGPSKKKIKLRCTRRAQRTRDPAALQSVLLNFEGRDELCTRSPHLEGAQVFGSENSSSSSPLELMMKTHRLDTLNFSCPDDTQRTTISHASPLPTIVEESSSSVLEVPPPLLTDLDFFRITIVQESKVNKKLMHIVQIPYMECWAMHDVKKKNTAKIVFNSKSTPTLAYLGVWKYYKFTTPNVEKIFFSMTTLSVLSKVHVASGPTNSLLTKNNFQLCLCGMSSLVQTSTIRRSSSLKMSASSYRKTNTSRPLAFLIHPLLRWTFLE